MFFNKKDTFMMIAPGLLWVILVIVAITACATMIPNQTPHQECKAMCRRALIRCEATEIRNCAQLACKRQHTLCLDAECGVK